MSDDKTTDDTDLRIRGIKALNDALGPSAAPKFLGGLNREPTDYVAISRRLYKGQSVDDIFDRAKGRWKTTP